MAGRAGPGKKVEVVKMTRLAAWSRMPQKVFLYLTIMRIFSNHHKCFPGEQDRCRCASWLCRAG